MEVLSKTWKVSLQQQQSTHQQKLEVSWSVWMQLIHQAGCDIEKNVPLVLVHDIPLSMERSVTYGERLLSTCLCFVGNPQVMVAAPSLFR
jgi:hypothetical protein